MESLVVGKIVNVQAYKADGTLYRQWNGVKVLEVSPEQIVLFMFKTKVSEKMGQRWIVREPILWWMPRDKWFNTTGLIRKSGTHYYTNIASIPFYEDETIKFIDYDLDVKAYPDQKTKVVDRNEFIHHTAKYGYSDKLVRILEQTTKEVVRLINLEEGFFDRDVIDTYIKELIEKKDLSRKFLSDEWD